MDRERQSPRVEYTGTLDVDKIADGVVARIQDDPGFAARVAKELGGCRPTTGRAGCYGHSMITVPFCSTVTLFQRTDGQREMHGALPNIERHDQLKGRLLNGQEPALSDAPDWVRESNPHQVGSRRQLRQRSSDSQSWGAPVDSIVSTCEVGNSRSSVASCCAQSLPGSMAGRRYAMMARAL